jgi:UDP-N-acetylmuramoyl-L-alanyl-D-glutamate--2,6-diaminopimelate ligase
MLRALVEEFGGEVEGDVEGVEVTGARLDSRAVQVGDLFCALPGTRADGGAFIEDAALNGAACVLAPAGTSHESDIPVWCHERPRDTFGAVAARLHGDPSKDMKVVAVTGTNGKTTVAHLTAELIDRTGESAACLGTVGHRVGGEALATTHTTPDAAELQRLLARHHAAGGRHACLEASSHALDQERLAGLSVDVAVFTNLSVDHLDYHGDLDEYARSKRRLFEALDEGGVAVVNAADPRGEEMAEAARAGGARVLYFGRDDSELRAREVELGSLCTSFELVLADEAASVETSLLGRFGLENALAAAGAATACGLSIAEIASGLTAATSPPGRMELVDTEGRGFTVLVDFAHTARALEGALETLRPLLGEGGSLSVVFGCGGERDKSKRAPMGRAAAEGADRVYITSDNPRGEDPQAICEAVLEGARDGDALVEVEPDRRRAIRAALNAAGPGDVVLIAGKGHESQQEIAGEKASFDDRLVAARELQG